MTHSLFLTIFELIATFNILIDVLRILNYKIREYNVRWKLWIYRWRYSRSDSSYQKQHKNDLHELSDRTSKLIVQAHQPNSRFSINKKCLFFDSLINIIGLLVALF